MTIDEALTIWNRCWLSDEKLRELLDAAGDNEPSEEG